MPLPPGRRDGSSGRRPGRPGRSSVTEGESDQVEGRQAVRELLRARRRRVHQVLVVEGTEASGSAADIVGLARSSGVPVRFVSRQHLEALARTDASQGVLARADPLPTVDLAMLVHRRQGRAAPFLVVLDGVTDPHNLGAVMRSALGAGATGVVIGAHRSAQVTPAVAKAAAGAVEHLPVAVVPGIAGALNELSQAGVWTVGLDAAATGSLWDLAIASEPVALVLGAEGRGLSRLVEHRCDLVVSVPLHGPIGSLNVAAAATLACFEVSRRRNSHHP